MSISFSVRGPTEEAPPLEGGCCMFEPCRTDRATGCKSSADTILRSDGAVSSTLTIRTGRNASDILTRRTVNRYGNIHHPPVAQRQCSGLIHRTCQIGARCRFKSCRVDKKTASFIPKDFRTVDVRRTARGYRRSWDRGVMAAYRTFNPAGRETVLWWGFKSLRSHSMNRSGRSALKTYALGRGMSMSVDGPANHDG